MRILEAIAMINLAMTLFFPQGNRWIRYSIFTAWNVIIIVWQSPTTEDAMTLLTLLGGSLISQFLKLAQPVWGRFFWPFLAVVTPHLRWYSAEI